MRNVKKKERKKREEVFLPVPVAKQRYWSVIEKNVIRTSASRDQSTVKHHVQLKMHFLLFLCKERHCLNST